jgi:hypothetical protein
MYKALGHLSEVLGQPIVQEDSKAAPVVPRARRVDFKAWAPNAPKPTPEKPRMAA